MNTNTTNTAKRGRGRPRKSISVNFGNRPFTVDAVLKRHTPKGDSKPSISRAAVTAKIREMVKNETVVELRDKRIVNGRGHPTYRFMLAKNVK